MIHVVGKYIIQVPQDHALPSIQSKNPLYDKGFLPALKAILEDNPSGLVIDIGANVGDTAALIATCADNPIICVEGSSDFLPFLQKNITQLENDVRVIDKYVDIGLELQSSVSKCGTNKLLIDSAGTPLKQNSLISIHEILSTNSTGLALFKTDTDGCDIEIVNQFLEHELSKMCPIFMEFDTSFDLTPRSKVIDFLKKIENNRFSCCVFTNRGLPLFFQETIKSSLLLDISAYCNLQRSFNYQLEYLDLILIPEEKLGLWKSIAGSYRQRKVI